MVGFLAQGKLKKAAMAGGVPQDICAAGDGIGASWGSDDMIYFTPLDEGDLARSGAEAPKRNL